MNMTEVTVRSGLNGVTFFLLLEPQTSVPPTKMVTGGYLSETTKCYLGIPCTGRAFSMTFSASLAVRNSRVKSGSYFPERVLDGAAGGGYGLPAGCARASQFLINEAPPRVNTEGLS